MDRDGIFAGDNPFALARAWLDAAVATEPADPNAIALATVDAAGLPNVRMVLLKEIEDEGDGQGGGFVFYTNTGSAKGTEIAATGRAAFVMHWKSLARQVRVRGTTEEVGAAQADAYYRSRALKSRIGAWASDQSRPLKSRQDLMAKVARAAVRHGTDPDRPPFWTGLRIVPSEIEFWADGPFRLHDRFRWTRPAPGAPWSVERLNP